MSSTASKLVGEPSYRVVCTKCEYEEESATKPHAERAARHHEQHGVFHFCDVQFIGEGEESTKTKTDCHYGVKEPWRERCPECDAPRTRVRKRVAPDQCYADDPNAPLYCDECSTALYGLWDKKLKEVVRYGSEDEPEGNAGDGLSDVNPYEWKL